MSSAPMLFVLGVLCILLSLRYTKEAKQRGGYSPGFVGLLCKFMNNAQGVYGFVLIGSAFADGLKEWFGIGLDWHSLFVL